MSSRAFVRWAIVLCTSWLALTAVLPATALAQPAITRPVTDETGVLSAAAIDAIEARLHAHRDAGHPQIALLLVHTTRGEPITDYANRVATAWGGGTAAADDGVLFVLALDDHEMRIEVGYGLEATITDAIAMRILDELVTPLREGLFDAAVWAVSDALIVRTGGQSLPLPTTFAGSGTAAPRESSEPHAGTRAEADADAERAWRRREQEDEAAEAHFLFVAAGFVLLTLLFVVFFMRGSNTSYGAQGVTRTDWSRILPIVVGLGAVLVGTFVAVVWFGPFGLFALVFVGVFAAAVFGGPGSGGAGSSRHAHRERSHRSHRSHDSSFGGGGGGGGRSYGGGGGGFGGGGASKRW